MKVTQVVKTTNVFSFELADVGAKLVNTSLEIVVNHQVKLNLLISVAVEPF